MSFFCDNCVFYLFICNWIFYLFWFTNYLLCDLELVAMLVTSITIELKCTVFVDVCCFFANILQTSWLVAKVIWSVKFLSTAQKMWHWSDWQNGRLNSSLKLLRSRRAVTTAETSWAVLKSSSTQSLVQISILRTRMIDVWVQRIWVTSFKKF